MRQVIIYEAPSWSSVKPLASLRRLRAFSQLIRVLTLHRLKVRYARTRLGYLWALLQPLSLMLVFTWMFSLLGRAPGGSVPYPVFAYAALVPWTGFASGLANATSSLTAHSALLTKVAFPREILPLTYVVVALIDMGIASVALVGLLLWYGIAPGASIMWVVPAVALMCVFQCGLALLMSAVHVRYRDLGIAVPILLQVWMFVTPVIYPLEAAQSALPPPLYWLYTLNPMVAVVDTFRRATLLHAAPDGVAIANATLTSLVLLPLAYMYFKHSERTMADVV